MKWLVFILVFFVASVLLKYSIILGVLIYPAIMYLTVRTYSAPVAGGLGFLYGLVYFFTVFFWFNLEGIEFVVIAAILTGLCMGFAMFLSSFVMRKGLFLGILAIPILYYDLKFFAFKFLLHANYALEIPVLFPFLHQHIGIAGVHVLLMLFSISLVAFYKRKEFFPVLLGFVVLFVTLFVIQAQLEAEPLSLRVGLVQANFPTNLTHQNTTHVIQYYDEKIRTLDADLIVLSESTYFYETEQKDIALKNYFLDIVKEQDKGLIYSSTKITEPKKVSAKVLLPSGALADHISTTPYQVPGEDVFEKGERVTVYNTSYGRFGIMICFEALRRDLLQDLDIDYLVVIANNNFMKHNISLDMLRWNVRDIAGLLNKHVIVVSNNGPTLIVDPYGRVLHELPYNTQGNIVAEI